MLTTIEHLLSGVEPAPASSVEDSAVWYGPGDSDEDDEAWEDDAAWDDDDEWDDDEEWDDDDWEDDDDE